MQGLLCSLHLMVLFSSERPDMFKFHVSEVPLKPNKQYEIVGVY